ncbi:uncharacterized protein LOC142329219 [Lycorma delicatula]|uniref:uncharacterized protein LOC142329219 n=1 Tax=Lycorma delicatula TaxID=130591 RepID=UPI003F51284D
MDFKWKRIKNNKAILIEKHDIQYKWFVYLNKVEEYRVEGRPIFYIDETYILSSHCQQKCWQPSNASECFAVPISKEERIIVIHTGGEMGFVPNCLTVWKAKRSSGDYHSQINCNMYLKWIREKLMPNFPVNSVIILYNASYHNSEKS